MLPDDELLIELLVNVTAGRPIINDLEVLSSEQLDRIYSTARKHDVMQLVYYALKQNRLLPNDSNSDNSTARKTFYSAFCQISRLQEETRSISAAFEAYKIRHIMLKGSVLRKLYPAEWMRSSGDIDCLIDEKDLDQAVSILEKLGYVAKDQKEYHDIVLTKRGTRLELHFSICENNPQLDVVLSRIWENAVPNTCYAYAETPEFFVFHHIAHMAYHLMAGGCGIKYIVDMQIIKNKLVFDDNSVVHMCEEAGLSKFYVLVNQLCAVWYERKNHNDGTKCLQELCFKSGIFGTRESIAQAAEYRVYTRRKNLTKLIFLSFDELCVIYPTLKNKKYLLPVFEVKRWIRKISNKKGIESLYKVVAMKTGPDNSRYDAIMNTIGLRELIR